jgi:4-methyl-5(b-hydroxyethyl)-thiazole monophosphate biosynthesis
MEKKAIILLAEGFEEVEAVTPIDYLRRAGLKVKIAAIGNNLSVTGARGIQLTADILLSQAVNNDWDAVLIPGGMPGASNLASSGMVGKFITNMAAKGKLICAICASPAVVLAPLGLITGNFTCYPGMEEKVTNGIWSDDRVVRDGNIITSRSAGTAGEFAIAIINALLGNETGKKIASSVLLN